MKTMSNWNQENLFRPPLEKDAIRLELLRRVDRALKIADRAIQYLGKRGFNDAEEPEGNFAAEKPIAETAMLLYVANRIRGEQPVADAFQSLAQTLIPLARSRDAAWDTVRYPSVCLQLATAHILLAALGWQDPEFDKLVFQSQIASASKGHEVIPYRELEVIWLQSIWRSETPPDHIEKVAQKTALGNSIDLLNGTRDDAYAHTHALMYYTDFGKWQRPLPRRTEDILGESTTVLARALVIEDYDLAAEALMAWPLTCSNWTPSAAFGFRVLCSLEDKVGFLPAGPLIPKRLGELSGQARTKYALATSYHTAYVMGMLSALSLNLESSSPFEIVGRRCDAAVIGELQMLAPKTGAHWEQVFQSLSADEQTTLGSLLLDIAIIQSSRKSEFAQMARLLEIAFRNGMANTAFCAQSADFLSRVARFGEWSARLQSS
jgi:hypothetical protein